VLELTPEQMLTTTRAVRKRLDFERPVERSVIEECVELALQAPTGGNRQMWHFVFVEDAEKRMALAELYRRVAGPYLASQQPDYKPDDPRAAQLPRVRDSAAYLAEHLHEVPVHFIPCAWGRLPEGSGVTEQAGFWGSILPAVWSFMLAARLRGLGTAWTTLHLPFEKEAADLLGIPYEKVTQAGLIPVAYTKGTDFKPAQRLPGSSLTHWDSW
jgi:nitroreductase